AFALEELALHLTLLRHVPSDDHHARVLPQAVDRLRGQLNPELASGRSRGGPFVHVGAKGACRQGLHEAAPRRWRRRGDQIFDSAPDELGAIPTEECFPRRIRIENQSLLLDDEDAVGGGFEQPAEFCLGKRERLNNSLLLGDVVRNRRRPDDAPCGVSDRRDRDRRNDCPAVLPQAGRLEASSRFPATETLEDLPKLHESRLGDDHRNRLADCLRGREPVHALGARIPSRDPAVQGLADNRILRALNDRGRTRRPGTPSRCWRQSTSPIRARCGRAHRKPLIRLGDRPRRSVRRALLRSGLRGASPTLSLLSPVPIRAANPALRVVEDRLRITLAIDPSRPGALALLKPSGRLFRVLISPRTRVCVAKVDPDASVLRLETPATRPLRRGGDRTRNGRGEYRRPLESGRRARARWNVPAPPGLPAFE